jgi:hypothetical protein
VKQARPGTKALGSFWTSAHSTPCHLQAEKFAFSPNSNPEKSIRSFGASEKIDAFESYTRVFVGAQPFVPLVLALLGKVEKEFLIICHQISGKSLRLKIAAS